MRQIQKKLESLINELSQGKLIIEKNFNPRIGEKGGKLIEEKHKMSHKYKKKKQGRKILLKMTDDGGWKIFKQ